jgi:acetoin utilization deacetylase AcuC-like enzyme
VNVPLPRGTGDRRYLETFDRIIAPIVEQDDPDLLVVGAGGDAETVDPLGRNDVTKAEFDALGRRARELAGAAADGRLAPAREGGYNVSHLAYAMLGTVEGVLGVDSTAPDPFAWLDGDFDSTERRIPEVCEYYADGWGLG